MILTATKLRCTLVQTAPKAHVTMGHFAPLHSNCLTATRERRWWYCSEHPRCRASRDPSQQLSSNYGRYSYTSRCIVPSHYDVEAILEAGQADAHKRSRRARIPDGRASASEALALGARTVQDYHDGHELR